jgi:hypothetical protein
MGEISANNCSTCYRMVDFQGHYKTVNVSWAMVTLE